jgi:hypothetical protein
MNVADDDSRRIIGHAHEDADEIRRGADEYAVSVLIGLEADVVKTLQSIKKGIALLDERRAELLADLEPEDGDPGTEASDDGQEPQGSARR